MTNCIKPGETLCVSFFGATNIMFYLYLGSAILSTLPKNYPISLLLTGDCSSQLLILKDSVLKIVVYTV